TVHPMFMGDAGGGAVSRSSRPVPRRQGDGTRKILARFPGIFQSVTRKIWCVPESSNSDHDVVGGGRVFRVAGLDVDMDGEKAEADAAREAPRVFTMDGGFHAMRGLEGRQVVGHVEGGPLVLGPQVGG